VQIVFSLWHGVYSLAASTLARRPRSRC